MLFVATTCLILLALEAVGLSTDRLLNKACDLNPQLNCSGLCSVKDRYLCELLKLKLPRHGKSQARRSTRGRNGQKRSLRGPPQSTGNQAYSFLTASGNSQMVNRSMPLFPLRTRRSLPYFTYGIALTSGAGSAGGYVFSANGLFDPDVTGTGTQPMGFDEMMHFYNHYTVVRARIQVEYNNQSAAYVTAALAVSGAATVVTSVETIMETGKVTTYSMNNATGANSQTTLRAGVNCAKFQGIQGNLAVMSDPMMRGDASTNPLEQIYFILYIWAANGLTVVNTYAAALIEYDVIFHEPRSGSLSSSAQREILYAQDPLSIRIPEEKLGSSLPAPPSGPFSLVPGFIRVKPPR